MKNKHYAECALHGSKHATCTCEKLETAEKLEYQRFLLEIPTRPDGIAQWPIEEQITFLDEEIAFTVKRLSEIGLDRVTKAFHQVHNWWNYWDEKPVLGQWPIALEIFYFLGGLYDSKEHLLRLAAQEAEMTPEERDLSDMKFSQFIKGLEMAFGTDNVKTCTTKNGPLN